MRDPHLNIFYYYRGPSTKNDVYQYDIQLEDNTTKSLINILEFCCTAGSDFLLYSLLEEMEVKKQKAFTFHLQKGLGTSRVDAVIEFLDYSIHLESKVKARLDPNQIKNHLVGIGSKDILFVITNNQSDKELLDRVDDKRIRYMQWKDLHRICLRSIVSIKKDKKLSSLVQLVMHFIDYLEMVIMTEFSGFRDADFDFWVERNPDYVPILRKKLQSLADIIKEKLPEEISGEYSSIKQGNISKDTQGQQSAWIALKPPESSKNTFGRCNFTLEVSKSTFDIVAVIRDGHMEQKRTPVGIFYNKLSNNPEKFLGVIRSIDNQNARIAIYKRRSKYGDRFMPGSEWWDGFFQMRLREINSREDISYICSIMRKADEKPSLPGIHIMDSIDRGKVILTNSDELEEKIVTTIVDFNKVLVFLKES